MKNILAALALAFLLPLALRAQDQPTDDEPTSLLQGTMVHTTVEGGCWYLDANDGKHYELIGDEGMLTYLKQEGKYVQLRVVATKGMASTCMVGQIVRVVEDVTPHLHPSDPAIIRMEIAGIMKRDGKTWYVKTAKGLRYEFDGLPARKYRKIGRRYHQTVRVVVVPGERGRSGMILGPDKLPTRTLQQPEAAQKPTPDPR